MDRKQYNRIVIESDMKAIIDDWHVCPFTDRVEDLFQTLNVATQTYIKNGPLTTKYIVNIVKDLRAYLNPDKNKNLHYFTDHICDKILFKFKGLDQSGLTNFEDYLQACILQVYTRA